MNTFYSNKYTPYFDNLSASNSFHALASLDDITDIESECSESSQELSEIKENITETPVNKALDDSSNFHEYQENIPNVSRVNEKENMDNDFLIGQENAYQILYDDFIKRSNNIDTESISWKKIKGKIDEILSQHSCFDSEKNKISFEEFHRKRCAMLTQSNPPNITHTIYPANSNQLRSHSRKVDNNSNTFRGNHFLRNSKHQNNSYSKSNFSSSHKQSRYSHYHSSLQVRKKIGGNDNEYERHILSLLNKVTEQNFTKMKQSILDMCKNENITQIIVIQILRKAHKDYSFIHLYMKLLLAVSDIYPHVTENASIILMDNFTLSLPLVLYEITKNINGENNLSLFIKAKKDLYDLNKCICSLISYGFVKMNPLLYLENIKRIFDQILKQSDYEIYDIFIHFIFDFFTIHSSSKIKMESRPMINGLFDQKNESICSKRTDFKWQDLLKFFVF